MQNIIMVDMSRAHSAVHTLKCAFLEIGSSNFALVHTVPVTHHCTQLVTIWRHWQPELPRLLAGPPCAGGCRC